MASGGSVPLVFADPLVPATPASASGTPETIPSNSATITSRGIWIGGWQRGSAVYRTVSSIEGSGGQAMTSLGAIADGTNTAADGGTRIAAYSSSAAATYSATATMSGSVWTYVGLFLPTENFTLVELIATGANDAATSLAHTLTNTPQSEDLILSFCSVRSSDAYSLPSGMAALQYDAPGLTDVNISASSLHRFRGGWRRAGGAGVTWSGLATGTGDSKAALTLHLRRAA